MALYLCVKPIEARDFILLCEDIAQRMRDVIGHAMITVQPETALEGGIRLTSDCACKTLRFNIYEPIRYKHQVISRNFTRGPRVPRDVMNKWRDSHEILFPEQTVIKFTFFNGRAHFQDWTDAEKIVTLEQFTRAGFIPYELSRNDTFIGAQGARKALLETDVCPNE